MLYSVHYAINRVPAGRVARGDRSTCREIGTMQVQARDEQTLHRFLDHKLAQMAQAYGAHIEVTGILYERC